MRATKKLDASSAYRQKLGGGMTVNRGGAGRDGMLNLKPYDRKLEEILRQAAAVFRARGYHQASMRDISRATGVSLAGLYYYFSSKEELLYLIQRHAFETILASARQALEGRAGPELRLRTLVRRHVQFFLQHPNEMKVLTHEEEWLEDERRRDVRSIKKAYYQLCFDEVEALKKERGLQDLNTRLAVLSLFGMMNWIYTWYNAKVDPGPAAMAEQMAGIFLRGVFGYKSRQSDGAGATGVRELDDVLGPNGDDGTTSTPDPVAALHERRAGLGSAPRTRRYGRRNIG